MPTKKEDFATLVTPGSKKVSICARRVGTRDRLSVIAVCTDESNADKIVEALNLRQGEITKINAPAQKVLDEVRDRLKIEQGLTVSLQNKISTVEAELRTRTYERDRLQTQLTSLTAERDRLLAAKEPAKV